MLRSFFCKRESKVSESGPRCSSFITAGSDKKRGNSFSCFAHLSRICLIDCLDLSRLYFIWLFLLSISSTFFIISFSSFWRSVISCLIELKSFLRISSYELASVFSVSRASISSIIFSPASLFWSNFS